MIPTNILPNNKIISINDEIPVRLGIMSTVPNHPADKFTNKSERIINHRSLNIKKV